MNPSCLLHPDEQFTIFCPSCLFQRLTSLDPSSSTNPSSRRSSTSAAAAIKSIFTKSSNTKGGGGALLPPKPTKSITFFPQLRRSNSFAASRNDAVCCNIEPNRKSCDVGISNFTLKSDSKNSATTSSAGCAVAGASSSSLLHTHLISKDSINVFEGSVKNPVLEAKEDISGESEEEFEDCEIGESIIDEIGEVQVDRISSSQIVEEEEMINDYITLKPMKEFLDIDSQSKKQSGMKEIAGSFRSAASVFSKKWHNWRRKQKVKMEKNGESYATLPVEKGLSRHYREGRLEVGDYGVRRRSCDIDPRLTLDAGRISFDDPRCSFEQPRASWDGHLIGRSFPKMNPMDSLVEDAPVVHIPVVDNEILVKEQQGKMSFTHEDDDVPGGSAQTRDYYADSSTRRRKSLDRSISIRKTAASVVAEIDELKAVYHAKVTPATIDNFHGEKVLVGEGVRKESNSNSSRNDCPETFEVESLRRSIGNEERKGTKKSRWSWKLWAFINKRSGWRKDDDVRYSKSNGVERSLSESCQELRGNVNVELRESLNGKMVRSKSSVSRRNLPNVEVAFGNVNRPENETNDPGKKRRDEFVLGRNRSGRYSPNNIDNGLLRFYLTPMRGSHRVGPGKNRLNSSHSIARRILQLY